MRFRVTNKELVSMYGYRILSVGYCNAQYLLGYEQPVAYKCGRDGWHYDVYDVNGYAICTGYGGYPKCTKCQYDIVRAYEKKACKVTCSNEIDFREKPKLVKKILFDFVNEITGGKTNEEN